MEPMTQTQHNSRDRASSRGLEGRLLLLGTVVVLVVVIAAAALRFGHLLNGIAEAIP